ncbi:SCP2 sterol-binding domain-containing protein [Nannocystis bainbridge]|uniref:SCP2 sterol-binding domain-containing protein n=1 Tax=Nannocystis bainbridge TaxID=2995303 RepID=A0ABT5E3C6_9BACT|nr:SCP2 sterol-binding domain-containing protein [Nannocystis bainbridge]MDC0720371.1 SCP2 sterol-binding domain-containing protein [Nannocystis bainbridge]
MAIKVQEHPTVVQIRSRPAPVPVGITSAWLREVALAAGADDVGFVAIDRPEVATERPFVEEALPGVRTLVAFVVRMNRDSVRSPARSVANQEFHRTGDHADEVAQAIARALVEKGHRAVNPSIAFPMEMARWPARIWVVSHKVVAVAAGLGQMGLHRNLIHPRFGNFILLGTVLTDAPVDAETQPIDYNPCIDCKLCVSACPVGAIQSDGHFDFSACNTHNYREFMGGFVDWVATVADSKDGRDYRERVSDKETVSMWQSLAYGPNYKAAYCMAVCPAGEDVLGTYLNAKAGFLRQVVRPLQDKVEPLYVLAGSDAEAHAARRFPHKRLRRVRSGLSPDSARGFVLALPLIFQRGRAKDMAATLRFRFTGAEQFVATIRVAEGKLTIVEHEDDPADVVVEADAATWLGIASGKHSPVWAVMRGRLRLRGDRKLFQRFMACLAR